MEAIRVELARLPKVNAFGESNDEDRQEVEALLADLQRDEPKLDEVKAWLSGKWSTLCDFLPDEP
jgi:ABC-type cobalamin/Fe3+-siderophores transport system ATPase subunit